VIGVFQTLSAGKAGQFVPGNLGPAALKARGALEECEGAAAATVTPEKRVMTVRRTTPRATPRRLRE
jgi:hypothetical protein